MNEIGFQLWLIKNGKNKKTTKDAVSRLKKLEKELGKIDIDSEYKKDQCCYLLSLFNNTGKNPEMEKYHPNLPIGKYYLSAYKYNLKQYINYLESFEWILKLC